jgi:hypothetical protein
LSYNCDFRGHGEQKNIAIGECRCDWILLLDADEVVTAELSAEIQSVLQSPAYEAYMLPRLNLFLSRWMRHGGLYPDRKLRLFKKGVAPLQEGVGPHATPQFKGRTGVLRNHFLHYGYPDFTRYLEHMNKYSSDVARPLVMRYRTAPGFRLISRSILNPFFGFLKNYVFRLGFLDGAEGLVFHLNHAIYVHWKYVKVWEQRAK